MMTILLAVAFAPLCIWLIVRVVNRRERWAMWTSATVVGVPVLYVASFGPACWIVKHNVTSPVILESIFKPCLDLAFDGPKMVQDALWCWSGIWGDRVLFDAAIARLDAENEQRIADAEQREPPTYCVVGMMSDGDRDLVATGLTLEMAEQTVKYVLRTKLRDNAVVESEANRR